MEERLASAAEVNRLYWETEDSVAEIANHMGVSRRALYEQIEPLAAGIECASCGAQLHYTNRSAKAAGVARCLMCGQEREIGADVAEEDIGTIPPYGTGLPEATPRSEHQLRDRTVMIAGFAIAGFVLGALATVLVRRAR